MDAPVNAESQQDHQAPRAQSLAAPRVATQTRSLFLRHAPQPTLVVNEYQLWGNEYQLEVNEYQLLVDKYQIGINEYKLGRMNANIG